MLLYVTRLVKRFDRRSNELANGRRVVVRTRRKTKPRCDSAHRRRRLPRRRYRPLAGARLLFASPLTAAGGHTSATQVPSDRLLCMRETRRRYLSTCRFARMPVRIRERVFFFSFLCLPYYLLPASQSPIGIIESRFVSFAISIALSYPDQVVRGKKSESPRRTDIYTGR